MIELKSFTWSNLQILSQLLELWLQISQLNGQMWFITVNQSCLDIWCSSWCCNTLDITHGMIIIQLIPSIVGKNAMTNEKRTESDSLIFYRGSMPGESVFWTNVRDSVTLLMMSTKANWVSLVRLWIFAMKNSLLGLWTAAPSNNVKSNSICSRPVFDSSRSEKKNKEIFQNRFSISSCNRVFVWYTHLVRDLMSCSPGQHV